MFVLCTANAMLSTIVDGIRRDGIVYSIANTFELSAIVWIALFMAIRFAILDEAVQKRQFDLVLLTLVIIACFLPLGPATWAVLSIVSLYAVVSSRPMTYGARAGWIFLAVSFCMFWSKRLFNFFADFFLSFDAMLVSQITRTVRTGNLVAMPDGNGYLAIAVPCSSMANVSLAVLCWVLFTQITNLKWRLKNVFWCLLACLSVVAINVIRISLIGFFPRQYDLLHGPVGATFVSWVIIIVVLVICYHGVGRVRFRTL
jgi:exosortase/archaeosortase family protein